MQDSYPLLRCDVVTDETSILTQLGLTDVDYESNTVVASVPATVMVIGDYPIMRDDDDDAGFYVGAKGSGEPWSGAGIYESANDVAFFRAATIISGAVFGTTTTALGDWTGPRVFDEINTVTVNVGDGTLTSSTRDAVINDHSVNAMMIGSEFVQFITATLSSPGVYVLSRLLRGGRGTEWAMVDHAIGERVMLLDADTIRRVTLSNATIGIERYYKGVTIGRTVASVNSTDFTCEAVGLKPFSPIDARVTRDGSNNATISWQRRSRYSVRMIGAAGISVPLGEDSEAYEIDFYTDNTYTTVADTKTATTTSYAYSAADQTTAGLTPGSTLYIGIRQVSAAAGVGYELRAAA
jgi:hypothetical protein